METCNGKNKYGSEHEAKNVRRAVLKARNRKIRIYNCPTCHSFHLTSEPPEISKLERSMNKKTAKLLKERAKDYAKEKGWSNYEFGYKELKKLWNKTPANLKHTLGL